MPTKREYEDMIVRVDERTKKIPLIEKHLKELNDSVAEVTKAEGTSRAIADQADRKADNNSRNFFRFLIAFCVCLIAMTLGLGIPTWVG